MKRFKLRLSLSSLQFCRPSSFPESPSRYPSSFVNSKSFDISYPNIPRPPPSTPYHPTPKRHAPPKTTHLASSPKSYPKNPAMKEQVKPCRKLEEESGEQRKPHRKPDDKSGAGKVKESFAVVKRSEDPYADFKRSMLEMILEKKLFGVDDLEELLLCFLSLNSRRHHAAIVEAFAEIWEVLFCETPKCKRA
ncbi:transcription repressor OFP7-like [Actinidia eriantha]|uniref:transcription repressor OFP7-like n=1 Tax=Actinidia eriantha TaxID=165200 RepID=UPI0025888598|nr:transcription repressor OFP7-like [Actinidia eriantha]